MQCFGRPLPRLTVATTATVARPAASFSDPDAGPRVDLAPLLFVAQNESDTDNLGPKSTSLPLLSVLPRLLLDILLLVLASGEGTAGVFFTHWKMERCVLFGNSFFFPFTSVALSSSSSSPSILALFNLGTTCRLVKFSPMSGLILKLISSSSPSAMAWVSFEELVLGDDFWVVLSSDVSDRPV